jgi:hypothetical protein
MASENKKMTVPAALGLMLLSLGMASLIAISAPNGASAQELLEREQGGSGDVQSVCTPTQTRGTFDEGVSVGGTSAFDDYDADVDDEDSTAADTNITSTTIAGGSTNQSTSDLRDYIQEACIALQVGDTQGALMQLDLALNALGGGTLGNMTSTSSGTTGGTSTGGGTTTGGSANTTSDSGMGTDNPGTESDIP